MGATLVDIPGAVLRLLQRFETPRGQPSLVSVAHRVSPGQYGQ